MAHRGLISTVFAAVLFASLPTPAYASPDAPMCVGDQPQISAAPISLVQWRAPMCGPYLHAFQGMDAQPPEARAIEAYRAAIQQIGDANYEEARLQLDLAHRGLPRISDRIALQSARLELLRGHPGRAAEFFAEAAQSPHETVRVEASFGQVLALLRAGDPIAEQALRDLLWTYPEIPNRTDLLFEHTQSLLRQARYDEAVAAMHAVRVDHPGSRIAPWAESELARMRALGHETPSMTDEERVRRARHLVRAGPLEAAKATVAKLLDSPLTGEQHAEVHYLAGRLARDEGRWKAAETYLRTAQLFPAENVATAQHIERRAHDMAETASARDPGEALRQLTGLRARRATASIPSSRLVDMVRVASAAGFREEVDGIVVVLSTRAGVPSAMLFDAAMAAAGTGSEGLVIALLEDIAKRPSARYRTAAMYHLARAHERANRPTEAAIFFTQAKSNADLSGDGYYALWAENGLGRVERGQHSSGDEGLSDRQGQTVPPPPRASERALAKQLDPIGDVHADTYPWIGRAATLLRVGERDAATAELFETYLTWRHALGRPIARAGLTCIARADGRIHEPIASDVRAARIDLSDEDRATLAGVAATLGDMGTAGGFSGPDFLDTLPRAYEWLAVPAARRYGLDPNVLLAVMRVESAYQKHIVSYAGAVGLMQIMPRTGQLIAHTLGHDDFTPADLLDPRLNLEFAAWYLSSLIHRFDGRLPLAIAAYNGGPHNVRRWIQEGAEGTPLDVLLERIPFTQTHRYVRKVLVHYEAYRQQRDLPMPQLSVRLPAQRIDPLAF
ncbi:MAG: lytic transglycosylase domain-containing protein [Deltaproteobacteria bacterium]|nr:lytic transglycosylase domain-containing protein [Deltaproteobacteria bacterium]MBW1874502.1 lytic transglycosylase domain-containing protein [Deltaproteobacteria bacterium]